jgi:hypothetical protein
MVALSTHMDDWAWALRPIGNPANRRLPDCLYINFRSGRRYVCCSLKSRTLTVEAMKLSETMVRLDLLMLTA